MSPVQPAAEPAAKALGDFVGLPPIGQADLGMLAIAGLSIVIVYIAARYVARPLRKWLRGLAERLLPAERRDHIDAEYLGRGVADLIAFLTMTIVADFIPWAAYHALLFAIAMSLALALAVFRIARGIKFSNPVAMAVAVIAGVTTLSNRYDYLDRVQKSLDSIAVAIGGFRISMLTVLSLVLGGIVLYALARLAMNGTRIFIRSRPNLDVTQQLLAEKIAIIVIGVLAVFVGIDMAGIDMTALSIFSGTIGLGLGFGLQKIFSNLISGIILLMDRSIKPGDTIVISKEDIVGEVLKIGVRAASVITRDGKVHLIPNELLMTERVENWAYNSTVVRMRLALAVAHGSDLDLVPQLMIEAASETDRVQDDPKPVVRITELSENGIVHDLRFWIEAPEKGLGNVRGKIYRRILDKFAEHGIRLSNPARDVTITKLPPLSTSQDEA